ncbi:MAG: 2-C-methyl-D-erythritol 4-phosphate cytidylyltransferase [Actinobacteria bacterium HGW-Actinobacteria-6]|jgi:2-C-methyl-D-erythritol 4-phosphate cytidylyltransferase|nr:MAG: 2-C-methyl-D-erythritol 4-phosphate cytidylyltransferase [Actinobacteria bacterium HGW-Actinobacteria-6]
MSISAIIVAGGVGDRFGRPGGKQLAPLAGRSVLFHTLSAFELADSIDEVVVVVHPDRVGEFAMELDGFDKITGVVAGGQTRQASVAAGLEVVAPGAEFIVVHDGARPMVTSDMIDSAVRTLIETEVDGVVVGHPSYDTIKRVEADGAVVATEDRSQLWVAQTPQVFRATPLRAAYTDAREDGFVGTDDSSLVERAGGRVVMVLGPRDNIKVTVPEDIVVAERVLEARARQL